MTDGIYRDPTTGSVIYVPRGHHELVADENGDPSCSCGHKPHVENPEEVKTVYDSIRLISQHAEIEREKLRRATAPIVRLKDLPVGTHIKDEEQGNYELTVFGVEDGLRVWMEVYPHCIECTTFVPEGDIPSKDPGVGSFLDERADEYFRNWSVVLVPPLINEDLLDQINKFNEAKIARPYNR